MHASFHLHIHRILVLSFFLVCVAQLAAQQADSLAAISRSQTAGFHVRIESHAADSTYEYVVTFSLPDTILERRYSGEDGHPFGIIQTPSKADLYILDDRTFYLYGTRMEYAYYPFIYRTTDAGITWQTVYQTWPDHYDKPLLKDRFCMLNQHRGIWILSVNKRWVRYRLTRDGGFTWKEKRKRVRSTAFKVEDYCGIVLRGG